MIEFKILEINAEGTEIHLMANVKDEPYYENVYIKSVKIDTQDTYVEGGAPSGSCITIAGFPSNTKSIDLHLTSQDLNNLDLQKNFFIFYIQNMGTPSPDVPCGHDKEYNIGVVYNKPAIYAQGMNLIKSLGNNCEVSTDMMNFIAQTEGLDYALKTGNLPEAVSLWENLFSEMKTPAITNRCCCNG